MSEILARIRAELRANADEKTIGNYQRFFKETVKFYGVSLGTVDKIAGEYWKAKAVDGNIEAGEIVEVIKVDGLLLEVKPVKP